MAQITPKQALDRSATWLADEHGMTVGDDGTVTIDGSPPLSLALDADENALVVTHSFVETGVGAVRADEVMASVPDRGTSLHVAASVSKSGVAFTFTNRVYLDGFSRQALVAAVHELVAAVDRTEPAPAAPAAPAPARETAAPTDAAPTAVVEPVERVRPDTVEVEVAASGWSPSHRVPAGGMRAWDEPDPSAQPSSRLEARVELQIAERRGDWARAVGSNGWTGWVDARKLEPMKAAAARSGGTIDLGGFKLRPMPLVGAAGLALAAFLPWLSIGGGLTGGPAVTTNAFDIALAFLWDLTAAGSPYLGILVVGLAVVALVAAAASKPNPGLTTLAGVGTIAVTTLFLVQMYRGVTDGGGTISDVVDYLGLAPWVMFGSGIVLLAAARK